MKIGNGGLRTTTSHQTRVVSIAIFLILSGSISLHSVRYSTSDTLFIIADSSGPQFSDVSTPSDTYFDEQFHGHIEIDVVDEDGVDIVWMQYRSENETTWSISFLENNPPYRNYTYIGTFESILKPGYNTFFLKFFANDTLGNISESEIHEWTVYYMREEVPTPFLYYLLPVLVVSLGVAVLIGAWWYRKRH